MSVKFWVWLSLYGWGYADNPLCICGGPVTLNLSIYVTRRERPSSEQVWRRSSIFNSAREWLCWVHCIRWRKSLSSAMPDITEHVPAVKRCRTASFSDEHHTSVAALLLSWRRLLLFVGYLLTCLFAFLLTAHSCESLNESSSRLLFWRIEPLIPSHVTSLHSVLVADV